MSYELLNVHIRGIVPQVMHNGQLADSMNKWTRAIKEITAKRKKTDADMEKLAELEWFGSLYVDEEGIPAWPGENIEALIRGGARRQSKGKEVEKGIISNGNWRVIHDGPKEPEKLWKCEANRLMRLVVVNKSRVMQCRPIFPQWELKFEVEWDPDTVNRANVDEWLIIAGKDVGLSDWRPKFGRFEVISVQAM